MKNFLKRNFFKLSTLVLLVLLIGSYAKNSSLGDKFNDISFGSPQTFFWDDWGKDNYIGRLSIQGSLTGENLEKIVGRNNRVIIDCEKSTMECITYYLYQFGRDSVSFSSGPSIIPIVSVKDNLIVASVPDDTISCSRIIINIDRVSKETEWVQEPYNQEKPLCKDSDGSTYKWIIKKPGSEK